MFFVRSVQEQPGCSQLSTAGIPTLNQEKHLEVCVLLMAWSTKAAVNVLCISDAVFPSLEQNLTQISCSYKSPIRKHGLHWNETKSTGQ
jgi:hypothetical protein